MNLNQDQQVAEISARHEQLQSSSPAKSTPSDSEDGKKRDIRESCEKEAELVPEKAQSKDSAGAEAGQVLTGTSNVDVGVVKAECDSTCDGESQMRDQCSTSGANVNPASPL